MADFPLRLPMESAIGRSGQEAHSRLINGYPEITANDQGGKSQFAVYARPGLTPYSQKSFTGVARCLVPYVNAAAESVAATLIAVLGNQIVQFTAAGAGTVLTNLTGTDRITAALNENSTSTQIAMVGDSGTYWNFIPINAGESDLPTITNPSTGFAAPNSVCFLKGLYIFSTAGGLIFHSALNDGTAFNSLAFGYADSDPLPLVRGIADAGYYYVFGQEIMEIWQDVGTTPFALAPLQQYIPMGLLAKYSLARGAANGLIWVDHRGIVRYGRDGGALRVSTHTVERAVENLSTTSREALIGTYFVAQGHEYYCLSAPTEFTWVYDISVQRWFEWQAFGLSRWLINDTIWFNNSWVACDYRNGALYIIDAEEYDDVGNEFIFELWCPHVHAFRKSLIADILEIDIASGVGLLSGTSDDISPEIQIDFSDDGGNNFKGFRKLPIGAAGQYSQQVRSGCWGQVNPKGRIWRIRASARVLRSVIQAQIAGRQLTA